MIESNCCKFVANCCYLKTVIPQIVWVIMTLKLNLPYVDSEEELFNLYNTYLTNVVIIIYIERVVVLHFSQNSTAN